MKALVVDDDLTSRLVLEDFLSQFGEVETCGDGTEAVRAARLALAAGIPYELICMDIMMPVMNGLEALQLIRQEEESCARPRASKVIVVSSSDESSNIEGAFGQLCDAYLVKPVDAERFLDILACLCDVVPIRSPS
jgi:two-component system chemotaxis response regulator CheY